MSKKIQALGFCLFLIVICVWIAYSYSQVDLNLTLSSHSVYQQVQQKLTYLGYFDRPLSASIFLTITTLSYFLYLLFLRIVAKQSINLFQVKWLIVLSALLLLAYPAFSYDIFNYMFDARIVTHYGLNPVYFKALDFPTDPWIRFMHWTHRYYPYGIGWLVLSVMPSFLGAGKFVLTLLLYKIFIGIFHFGNCILIYLIAKRINPKKSLLSLSFYALNPLILIESLISPHNEVVMIFFTLSGIWLFLVQKRTFGVLSILIGASVKYLSIILLPFLYFVQRFELKKLLTAFVYFWSIALIPLMWQREPYSWYLIPVVALTSLVSFRKFLPPLVIGISAGLLVRYWPFLLLGDYGIKTQQYQLFGFIGMFTFFWVVGWWVWAKKTT